MIGVSFHINAMKMFKTALLSYLIHLAMLAVQVTTRAFERHLINFRSYKRVLPWLHCKPNLHDRILPTGLSLSSYTHQATQ